MSNILEKIMQYVGSILSGAVPADDVAGEELSNEVYKKYLKNNFPPKEDLNNQQMKLFQEETLFSLIMLVDGKKPGYDETLASVAAQSYYNWELIGVGSEYNTSFGRADAKSKVKHIIAEGEDEELIKTAIAHSKGDFILFLEQGDLLQPDALFQFVSAINARSGVEAVFSDEDVLAKDGTRQNPVFKPDLSPDTMLSYNCIGRPFAVKKNIYDKVGGLGSLSYEDEYDYTLKCVLNCTLISHVPKVLYSRKKEAEPKEMTKCRDSIKEYIEVKGINGYVSPGKCKNTSRVRFIVPEDMEISIIIPNRNNFENLKTCLESIEDNSTFGKYRLLIADYGSGDPKTKRYYEILEKNKAAKIHYCGHTINISKVLNYGALQAKADVLVFFDSNCTVISADWLESMAELAQQEHVGAVGGKIIDSADRIVNAGYVAGMGGWFKSVYEGTPGTQKGEIFDHYINTIRNVFGVSGLCMAITSDKFFNIGCFDETFEGYGGDMELCMRLYRKGYRNVYTPYSCVKYSGEVPAAEKATEKQLMRCYDALRRPLTCGDPYYSINYDHSSTIPAIAINPAPAVELNSKYSG